MLKSKKGLCSSKNPLWVAAFFFKQLKKAQILDSDISSAVDQILHHEMDAVSYRLLGYLLSGVVKIYSKQVEYLLADCNKMLFGISKFVIKTKSNTPVEKLRMSFIMPETFDLDAIDLGTLEDTSRFHTALPEQITLKDVLSNTAGFMQFSQERFDDFGLGETSCSLDHLMAENVLETPLLNFDFEAFPSSSSTNLLASKDILQSCISGQNVDEFHEKNRISREESIDKSMFLGRQKEAVLPSASFNESRQIGIEHNMAMESLRSLCQMDQENVSVDETLAFHVSSQNVDEFHEESRISQEESTDISMFLGTQKEVVLPSASFNESRQIGIEHNMAMESLRSLCQMDLENVGVGETLAFQENENFLHNQSSVVKESAGELIEESIVDPTPQSKFQGNLEVQKKVSFEHGQSSVNPAESTILDPTPQSKFQGGSIGRPKPGSTSTTSEFKLIPTPTATESARFSRKRKFVIDKTMVLPTEVLKRSILDASDLVSVRRPLGLSLLDKHRKYQLSSLLDRFNESLFTCHSAKLKSLFSSKKMKIPNSPKIKETLPESGVSESRAGRIPGRIEIPPRFSEIIGELDVSQSQTCGSSDHTAAAPETPPLCPNVKVRTVKQHERTETQNSDDFVPSSPHEREQSSERSADMVEEFNAETSNTYEPMDNEQCFAVDEDLNLVNEEMNPSETENSKMSGWSERTRKVASYLSKSFQDAGKQKESGSVNLSQVSQGRTRKESARLFYEILVLKTTNYVDVQQKEAYGDIAVKKLPKLDKTFGV